MPRKDIAQPSRKGTDPADRASERKAAAKETQEPADAPHEAADKAYGEMTADFHLATAGAIALRVDGRVSETRRKDFKGLGRVCLATSTRFDDAWSNVVARIPLEEINFCRAHAGEARVAIELARREPRVANLQPSLEKTSLAENHISAMLDRAVTSPVA